MGILTKTISSLSFFFVALILPGFIAQASPIQPLIQVESGALGSASHASAMPAAEVNAGAQPRQVLAGLTFIPALESDLGLVPASDGWYVKHHLQAYHRYVDSLSYRKINEYLQT
ncbi:hypothetical protein Agabi119p4_5317 [Agaricus bisporus var. burnettii]|uniref:Uncharacterized protein n=1 Tax=Agaricus bisporus var. burnettii TaxID=192524 RepID=A0A8H7F1J4_AGABI|nr:hypothetical protein Agabi119p4_5317 [Agaricus bisporus var. burnettii]